MATLFGPRPRDAAAASPPEVVVTTTRRRGARPPARAGALPTGELVRRASEQASRLVRAELALARWELLGKARRAAAGTVLIGGAAVVALYGLFGILAGLALLAARVLPGWAGTLLVAVVLVVAAGALGLAGLRQARRLAAPMPAVLRSVRNDVRALQAAVAHRPRRHPGGGHREARPPR